MADRHLPAGRRPQPGATEATLRGQGEKLVGEFPPAPTLPAAALAWADVTSFPDGTRCTLQERLVDILRRYPDGTVHQATFTNRAGLEADLAAVEQLLAVEPGVRA